MKKRTSVLASLLAAISFNRGDGLVDVELAKKPSWRDRPVRPYQEGDPVFTGNSWDGREWVHGTKRKRRQARIDEARTMVQCWREARNDKRREIHSERRMIGGSLRGLDRAVAIAERDYDRARGVVR